MFAVIDCGTTNTRIYIVDRNRKIVACGSRKVGVRDTSITGSRDALRQGITELFFGILSEHGIKDEEVEFAVASGMITSEIGLIEIPHLVAPAGLSDLSQGLFYPGDQKQVSGECAGTGSAGHRFYERRGGAVYWNHRRKKDKRTVQHRGPQLPYQGHVHR